MADYSEKIQTAAAHQERGELGQAEKIYLAILAEENGHPDANHLFGVLNHQRGDHQRAIELIGVAVHAVPRNPVYAYNLGVVHQAVGNADAAINLFRRTLSFDAQMVSAWVNLGNIQQDRGEFTDSYDCCRNAIRLQPDDATHYLRAGIVLRKMGKIEEAVSHLGRSLDLDPSSPIAISALLLASQYHSEFTPADLAQLHFSWAKRLAGLPLEAGPATFSAATDIALCDDLDSLPTSTSPSPSPSTAGKSLTLGFVSPDFGNHPVGIFLAPLLERLKGFPDVVTICFSDGKKDDEFTQRNRASADHWHDVASLSDAMLADKVRENRVDVLFDLSGHTESNRLRMFCERPAKVQITWAGYVGTTGLDAIDYILTDDYHTPPGLESHYSEKPVRMPGDYICYEPPDYAPERGVLPMLGNGFPTFGCLNNPAKISERSIRLWSRLLREHENSRLLLKYKGMTDPSVRTRIFGLFAIHGVTSDRIELIGQSSHGEHLNFYQKVDIALDPLSYSSGLTTCESRWMGVPVVTLPGDTFAQRHSLSHLCNAGVNGTVAADEDDFIRIVNLLIGSPKDLNAYRQELRRQVAESPLCDLDAYARDFVATVSELIQRAAP